jgi:hypothetical protein
MRRYAALLAGLCLLYAATDAEPASAQAAAAPARGQITVVLKSGAVFHGTFLGRDERNIRLRSSAGTVRAIPVGQVERVEGDMTPPSPAEVEAARPPEAAAPQTTAPTAAAETRRVGLGVSVSSLNAFALYVPIQDEAVRIEPAFSLALESVEGDSSTALELGIGLFGLGRLGDQSRTYYGGRLAFVRESVEVEDTSADAWAFRLAPALGIEWVPSESVAVGVEGQLGLSFGSSTFLMDVSGLLFVRVFAP